jgi:glycosyltransferase involved in cell wall biosynthesis
LQEKEEKNAMKVAQVAPLYESVPPKLYGGTERVVSYIAEELVNEGHDVTLYASGDSVTTAELRPICEQALRLKGSDITDPLADHIRMLEIVAQDAGEFDIVHFHIDYLHFPVTRRQNYPAVTTLHGRLDIPELQALFREFPEMNLVSISNSQREPMRWANWIGTVHHGLPENLYSPTYTGGKYLAFIGRISPEKRVDRAIEVAKRTGMPLKIAAKIDKVDQDYFDAKIKGLLDHSLVEYIGEIGEHEKEEFLGNASALLFLIDWQEPFGLVLTESMACGTPIIGYGMGSVPEVIDEGITGHIVHNMDDAANAATRIDALDRRTIRRVFEKRFTASRMCHDYLNIYQRIRDGEHYLSEGELRSSTV